MSGSESIYHLVPREYVAPVKEPMHRSKHDPNTPLTGSTFGCKGTTRLIGAAVQMKKDSAMFGPRGFHDKPDPKQFLRKSSMEFGSKGERGDNSFKYSDKLKAPVPLRDDAPVMGLHSQKNFITANAVEAILQVPRVIDNGEPDYLKKEDYGKTPEYLSQVKEEIKRERDMIDQYVKERMGYKDEEPDRTEVLPDDERERLLNALKTKWDLTNQKYQKITHMVNLDTVGQVRRKEALENELKQLEHDIEKLSRPGPILVRPY
mmetsp:Transcript_23503/g.23712  ORF Transcript_23503/g.23712 Transcript_23503/m.23712 type:complete len:262 (+) Transcript_23503:79-864(+)|eukprot:CAMPEP_0182427626 /NCGR_PEP_ID=MMETSP1167-20130531/18924_1 /TAXON_ID=2988 /ORGANISM="Mallomonas Sp, Strain CCMP3275" /LENGTH=261 /DNA_ID=CAMNT_0024609993 /DNA_START=76 /DNA_END=861 /DNA_ORIENTATION=+